MCQEYFKNISKIFHSFFDNFGTLKSPYFQLKYWELLTNLFKMYKYIEMVNNEFKEYFRKKVFWR